MSTHTSPFEAAFADMLQAAAEHAARTVLAELRPAAQPSPLALDDLGLEPMRAYTAREAARLLGITENSIYKIDEAELPRVRRNGTAIGFLGIHIIGYMHRLPPVDVAGCVERMRARLLEQAEAARPGPVRPLRSAAPGKTRVM